MTQPRAVVDINSQQVTNIRLLLTHQVQRLPRVDSISPITAANFQQDVATTLSEAMTALLQPVLFTGSGSGAQVVLRTRDDQAKAWRTWSEKVWPLWHDSIETTYGRWMRPNELASHTVTQVGQHCFGDDSTMLPIIAGSTPVKMLRVACYKVTHPMMTAILEVTHPDIGHWCRKLGLGVKDPIQHLLQRFVPGHLPAFLTNRMPEPPQLTDEMRKAVVKVQKTAVQVPPRFTPKPRWTKKEKA